MVKRNGPIGRLGPRIVGLIILTSLLFLPALYDNGVVAQGTNYSLRFYGHGVNDIDRVKIKIDNPAVPADVSNNFTLEFWMKANLADNSSNPGQSCGSFNWIYGNIIFDRDIFGSGDNGDYGLSLYQGRIRFGVGRGSTDLTICGATNVADGQWRHIAVTRNSSTGAMRIFVDGQQDAQGTGPTGDISYRNGRTTSYPNSDPYLVIGAEKHDAGSGFPSFNGFIDEVRISNSIRYSSNFTPSSISFTPDANTAALYHLNEGPAGACIGTIQDSSGASGGPSNGVCRYGGSGTSGPVYSTDTPFGVSPTPTPDTTAPAISNVEAYPLDTTVFIIWDTDEPATSQVRYGTGSPDTFTTETQTYVTSHSVAISGLSESTTYVYRVLSKDAAGNLATSAQFDFTMLNSADIERIYLPIIIK